MPLHLSSLIPLSHFSLEGIRLRVFENVITLQLYETCALFSGLTYIYIIQYSGFRSRCMNTANTTARYRRDPQRFSSTSFFRALILPKGSS